MKIHARKEFQGLVKRVESELDLTLKERQELGLHVPQDFNTFIKFYNGQMAKAQASFYDSTSTNCVDFAPTICINLAPIVSTYIGGQHRERLMGMMYYFDVVRELFANLDEELIFKFLEDPEAAIGDFEKSFGSEEELKKYQDFFQERGRSYQDYVRFAKGFATPFREIIMNMIPEMENAFGIADLSSLRHETDHIDFFGYPIYFDLHSRRIKTLMLEQRLHSEKDSSVSKEYARAKMSILETDSGVYPIIEIRALFFNHVKPGEWGSADLNDVKKRVLEDFNVGYIEDHLLESILNALVSVEWSDGRMDRQTSNYLFYEVNRQKRSPNTNRYVVRPDEVNYDVANRILNEELPQWKGRFARNAQAAVEVMGNAYRDNPSRLRNGAIARNFNEFIELCSA